VANIKSQKKRNITNAKAQERNKAVRSEIKSRVKRAVSTGDDEAVRLAVKRIDSAAQRGVIHKNAAARAKSRLMKKVAAGATGSVRVGARSGQRCVGPRRLSRATRTSITNSPSRSVSPRRSASASASSSIARRTFPLPSRR